MTAQRLPPSATSRLRFLSAPKIILAILVLALVIIIPLLLGAQNYYMKLVTTVLLFSVIATAWNIIGGMGGQLDLAAFAYVGLGAFTSGTLLIRFNFTPWIGMILGGLVAVAFALLVGYPLFRFGVREVWYAIASSALVEVLRVAFLMWDEIGGPNPHYMPLFESSFYHMRWASYVPFYWILLAFLAIALLLNWWIRRSKLGYHLMALAENEEAAEVLGVNAQASKLKALVIYAFLVGMTGGVYACLIGNIHPSFFDATYSTQVAILGIVGGMGVTYGPLSAAIVLVTMQELLRARLGSTMQGLYVAVYAVLLIVVALFRPKGIAPLIQDAVRSVAALGKGKHDIRANAPGN